MVIKPPADEAVFVSAMMAEDELGVVIRTHIYVEASLIELIHAQVTSSKHVDLAKLEFFQKVNLAIALGLNPNHGPPLLALGTLRNAFAHKLGTRITKDRIDNLYKSLSAEDKKLVQVMYEKTCRQQTAANACRFRALAPKDQFVLIAVTLRYMLVAAVQVIGSGGDTN